MNSFDINISIPQLSSYSASLRKSLGDDNFMTLMYLYAEYLKNLYLRMIKEEINSNRYKGDWEPKDEEGYLKYLGTEPSEDIFNLIVDSLEVKKIGYTLNVRFNRYYKYPHSHINLVDVLNSIEYGTTKFNARPVLRKSQRKIKYHIINLWRGFLLMKGVI